MKTAIVAAVLAALCIGCRHNPRPAPPDWNFRTIPSFERGEARIRISMTKQQVLAELPKSGLKSFKSKYRLRDPDEAMRRSDVWVLKYGSGKATAPGTGLLRITYAEDRVVKLEHRMLPLR